MNTPKTATVDTKLRRSLLLTIFLCLASATPGWSQLAAPLLIKATDVNGSSVIGELKSEEGDNLELIDLRTGKKVTFPKSALNDLRKGIGDREAAATIGLPEFLVWKIRRVIPGGSLSGKVAQIDASIVYVTLNSQNGIEKGQELFVYRGDETIKHPDTREALGPQRRRIAKLIVTEAQEKLSKAKLVGDLEVELNVGDTVEPASQSKPIAILPLVDLNGAGRAGGKKLAEDLTTGLQQGGISVVERNLLAKVLIELGLQNTTVFDAEKAQKIGKQLGAYAMLAGTMTASGYGSDVNLRLIRVETGEILFATRLNGPAPGPIIEAGSDIIVIPPATPAPPPAVKPPSVISPLAAAPGWKYLFNGRDLTGWKHLNPSSRIPCRVENGAIIGHGVLNAGTDNISTEQSFWNFTFRCEFMVMNGASGGVYLRGRHFITIADDYNGTKVGRRGNQLPPSGAIWSGKSQTPPLQPASRPAGQWQTFEATMISNRLTVILNGKKIQDNVECNQVSSGALSTDLSAPGPVVLWWPHSQINFRNIMINELR